MKILLVEDDPDDRRAFAEVIERLNLPIHLEFAGDAVELFDCLEKNRDIKLIFQDINMPFRNGKQCLRDLKSNRHYRDIPVIIYTVSASKQDIDEVYENGAHYYFIKPYAYTNLLETMKKIFSIDWTKSQPIPAKEDFIINMSFS
jgi:CheY-like chemotaxis protein